MTEQELKPTTEELTRQVLAIHACSAYNGTMTVEKVVHLVRESNPRANRSGIYKAIEAFGPIGECDRHWLIHPAESSRFYTPPGRKVRLQSE